MIKAYHYSLQLLNTACDKLGLKRSEFLVGSFFLFLGIAVRTRNYLGDLSLSNDEAALAGNLVDKSISALFGPLDISQVAPIGFCLVEKILIVLLGNNELSLRLVPFAAGVVALPLTFLFVRRAIGPFCAILCMAQLAVIPGAIFHSNNVKPYSLDLAIAIGLMLLAWGRGSMECSRKRLLWLGLWGGIALWFSFPAVFILFGIGVLWMIRWAVGRNWRNLLLFSAVSLVWLSSFWVQYKYLHTQTQNLGLLNFWEGYFMPFPPFTAGDLEFFSEMLMRVFKTPLWTLGARGSVVFFLLGCILIWRRNRQLLALILLPLILNLFVSGFHKYPFGERLLFYGVINLYIPIAVFLEWLWHRKWRLAWLRYVALILMALNLGKPTVNAAKCLAHPNMIEEMKQVVEYLADQREPDDMFFIHNSAYNTFSYYRKRFEMDPASVIVSQAVNPQTLNMITANLSSLTGRVWLVFGHGKQHAGTDYEMVFVNEAKEQGQLIDEYAHIGASTYLFQFPVFEQKTKK